MDHMDVASSIMSVPPMYRNGGTFNRMTNGATNIHRPASQQDLHQKHHAPAPKRLVTNSKSVGNVGPDVVPQKVKTKSETHLGPKSTSTNTTPISAHTPKSAESNTTQQSDELTDDVFSPIHAVPAFKYDTTKGASRTPSFNSAVSRPNYQIKQVDVNHGKTGQLRAFAVSIKQNSPDVIPTRVVKEPQLENDLSKLDINEEDTIEKKLNRLNELDRTLYALSDQIGKLHNDKAKLEVSIKKAKLSFSFGDESEF
jgi:hypothetical protein